MPPPEEAFKAEDHSPNIPVNNAPQAEDLITIAPDRKNLTADDTSKPPSIKTAENFPPKPKGAATGSDPKEIEKIASSEKKIPGKTTQSRLNPALAGAPSSQKSGNKSTQKAAGNPAKPMQKAGKTAPKTSGEKSTQKTEPNPLKTTQTTGKTAPQADGKKSTQKSAEPTTPKSTQKAGKTAPKTSGKKSTQKTEPNPLKTTQTTGKTAPQADGKKSTQKSAEPTTPKSTQKAGKTAPKTAPPVSSGPVENPPDLSSVKFKDFQDLKQKRGNPRLIYPQEARKKKIQGTVSIIYFISPEGLVDKIQLTKSSGSPLLDNQTLRTLARYEFFPGQEGWVRHTVAFILNGEEVQVLKLRTPAE